MEITLANGKGKVLVDYGDFSPLLSFGPWTLRRRTSGKVYAVSRQVEEGKQVAMHQVLMPPRPGFVVEHVNGNGLDNRRCNLRYVTRSQGARTSRLGTNNSSGYKGVVAKRFGKARSNLGWRASIRVNGKQVNIGTFPTAILAARAYDEAAVRLRGEFACTNVKLGLLAPV